MTHWISTYDSWLLGQLHKLLIRFKWWTLTFKLQSVVWYGCHTMSLLWLRRFRTVEENTFLSLVAGLGSLTITLKFAAYSRLPLKSSTTGFHSISVTSKFFILSVTNISKVSRESRNIFSTMLTTKKFQRKDLYDKQP